jgi:molybdopterin-guanine dinucleotide biosynthesis protein A
LNHNPQALSETAAGIVLCGGKSSRMGQPKALLPFGPELMLQRVVRILGGVVSPIVVVAAPGQELPPLPADILITHDEREGRGPLEGLLAGMTALQTLARRASSGHVAGTTEMAPRTGDSLPFYATSCDVPLLQPDFVRFVLSRLGDNAAAVPVEENFYHPLAAAYRLSILPDVEALLASNQLRPAFLFERVSTCRIPVDDLRMVDPDLLSLKNCNRPEDYEEALRLAGF